MAPVRPEFFYHPAVGVVSPTSLGLFAFKSGPLVISSPVQPPLNKAIAPKPLNRVTPPTETIEETIQDALPVTIHTTQQVLMETASTLPIMHHPEEAALPTNSKQGDTTMQAMKITEVERTDLERCIVTDEHLPRDEMIRFVVDPENNIVADLTEKLPVPGYWVKADRAILKKAIWRNSFTTAARSPVVMAKNLLEQVQLGLLRQSLETLGLARKAGLVTQGFAKVEEVLKADRAALYIVASDAKENGREKLEKLAHSLPIFETWTSSQLSAALGEDNAVHVVLTDGELTKKLMTIAQKLEDIR